VNEAMQNMTDCRYCLGPEHPSGTMCALHPDFIAPEQMKIPTEHFKKLCGWAFQGKQLLKIAEEYVHRCPMCNAGDECQDDMCFQFRAAIKVAGTAQPPKETT